ncbi:8273_t:CDS:1 [Scutellospora calospora]|uniref:8273_t:CDS:1 n=1 Tax=Scutellospora calospora TaxID=85575 RepID=A0ACA9LZA4_9GLOM|nr:8273_t:CDS:1 [Scutellospora calospora]
MPYVPTASSASKLNQGKSPANNQSYHGWPLAKDDFNANVISHSFANLSISVFSTNTSTNTSKNNSSSNTLTSTSTKSSSQVISIKKDSNNELDRDSAIKQVKDILSTSPQLSTSPNRRRSAPESFTRKPSLKVDLPPQLSTEIISPCLLRKKSGEIVKSSLKKVKSEPPTPTFPKYVHFNTDLEQIRLFKEAQKPQAVSAEVSSDEDSDDEDFEFSISDLDSDNENDDDELDLSITLPNMPLITTMHKSKPVFVESIFLSSDKRKLSGRIQVQNLAFQKNVEVRYTFDFWQSVSEVPATYAEGVQDKDNKNSTDLFNFSIELIDNSRNQIDGKTMYFAVHYKVNDRDFWDNNNGSNYQVNFKRLSSSSTKLSTSSKNYNNSKSSSITTTKTTSKWSTPINNRSRNFDADSPVRSPPIINSSSISMTTIKKSIGGPRYDIGLSLIAAQNVNSVITSTPINRTYQPSYLSNESFSSFFPGNCIDGMPVTKEPSVWENSPKGVGIFDSMNKSSTPIAIPSARPAIGSSSYCELVKQYCFYSGSPPVMT